MASFQELYERYNLRANQNKDEAFNVAVSNMNFDEFKDLLKSINGYVRNIPENEYGFHNNRMFVSDLITADIEMQDKVLSQAFEGIKDIPDRKAQAILIYNVINDLHLFSDGNGRTSRMAYELFANHNFKIENSPFFSHDNKDSAVISHEKFERLNGILSAEKTQRLLFTTFLGKAKQRYDMPEKLLSYNNIQHRGDTVEGDAGGDVIFIPEEIKKELSEKQIKDINYAILDSYQGGILSLLILAKEKGNLQSIFEINDRRLDKLSKYRFSEENLDEINGKLIVPVCINYDVDEPEEQDKIKNVFNGLKKEDYLKLPTISNDLRELFFRTMINVIKENGELYQQIADGNRYENRDELDRAIAGLPDDKAKEVFLSEYLRRNNLNKSIIRLASIEDATKGVVLTDMINTKEAEKREIKDKGNIEQEMVID
ncbi:MAG: Fic family protein [Oscillospiraceae bacterium]|nr:Fic family protein [Oscillospiraceae bacterium]